MQTPIQATMLTLAEDESSTIPAMLRTFHPFPKLPLELQLKIWKDACPAGRAIQLYAAGVLILTKGSHPDQNADYPLLRRYIPHRKVRTHKAPNILHASFEFGEETKRGYNLCFATELEDKLTWMDMETDGLCFETQSAFEEFYGVNQLVRSHMPNLRRNSIHAMLPQESMIIENEPQHLIIRQN